MQFSVSRLCFNIRALIVGGAIALLTVTTAPAQSFNIEYRVSLLGLTVGKASMSGDFGTTGYHMRADAKLAGLAALMSKGSGAVTSSGEITNGTLFPNAYATTAVNPKMTRTIRVGFQNRAVQAVDISPPIIPPPDAVPLTAATKQDIVDPLSAAILISSGSTATFGPDLCNRTLPIFDGVVRFNIVLSYKSTRAVNLAGYSGPVEICAARYRPIAGHRPDRSETKFMVANKDIEVWLAPLRGTNIALPVRISVASEVGTVDIRAKSFVVH